MNKKTIIIAFSGTVLISIIMVFVIVNIFSSEDNVQPITVPDAVHTEQETQQPSDSTIEESDELTDVQKGIFAGKDILSENDLYAMLDQYTSYSKVNSVYDSRSECQLDYYTVELDDGSLDIYVYHLSDGLIVDTVKNPVFEDTEDTDGYEDWDSIPVGR